jgi:hypothetical protein
MSTANTIRRAQLGQIGPRAVCFSCLTLLVKSGRFADRAGLRLEGGVCTYRGLLASNPKLLNGGLIGRSDNVARPRRPDGRQWLAAI